MVWRFAFRNLRLRASETTRIRARRFRVSILFDGIVECACAWQYGWALRLVSAITVSTYVLAGLAKVLGPHGRAWAAGESLRAQIAMDALRKELLGEPMPAWSAALYDNVALFTVMGVGTLAVELGAPLALLGRRLSVAWVIAAWWLRESAITNGLRKCRAGNTPRRGARHR